MTGRGCCEHGLTRFTSDQLLLICAWCFMKEQKLPVARSLGPPSEAPTRRPVSRVLVGTNKESFRQSILSICSSRICINRIFDVMPRSSPTFALSVRLANPQRTLRILIMAQWASLFLNQRGRAYGNGTVQGGEYGKEEQRDSLLFFFFVHKRTRHRLLIICCQLPDPRTRLRFEPHMI